MKMLLLALILLSVTTASVRGRFKVQYEWEVIDYKWSTDQAKLLATQRGTYDPGTNAISGLRYHDDYLYLTVPRLRSGIPATLVRMPYKPNENQTEDTSPSFEPYPSWKMNEQGDCKALQNVHRVEIDQANMMWILDNGRIRTLERSVNTCSPKLLIHDLLSNTTVGTFIFPEEVIGDGGGFLYDFVVDKNNGGYAYIADNSLSDPGLIVYSRKQNRSWKIRDGTMRADPDSVEFIVNGTHISTPSNIAPIAFNPHTNLLYFAPLSSRRLYSVDVKYLQDEVDTISTYVVEVGRKASQTNGMLMDNNGVLYYGLLSANSIAKWNTTLPFTTDQKVIARDPTFIQWPDSLAFDDSGNLLVVTNRLQKLFRGKYNINEANFRILWSHIGARNYVFAQKEIEKKENSPIVELPDQEVAPSNITTSAESAAGAVPVFSSVFVILFVRLLL